MYVCMYTYVCLYVVCTYVVCMYIYVCMHVRMCVCIFVRMYVCICMYVCMYVVCLHNHSILIFFVPAIFKTERGNHKQARIPIDGSLSRHESAAVHHSDWCHLGNNQVLYRQSSQNAETRYEVAYLGCIQHVKLGIADIARQPHRAAAHGNNCDDGLFIIRSVKFTHVYVLTLLSWLCSMMVVASADTICNRVTRIKFDAALISL